MRRPGRPRSWTPSRTSGRTTADNNGGTAPDEVGRSLPHIVEEIQMSDQWQRAASEAAKRHMAAQEDDTPYVAMLKAELSDQAPAIDPVIVTLKETVVEPCPDGCCDTVSEVVRTVEVMDDTKGPWFSAAYDGECSKCDGAIWRGDEIRADGRGGYECSGCYPHDDETPVSKPCQHRFVWVDDDNGRSGSFCVRCEQEEDPLPDVGLADDPAQQVPTADEFMNPGPAAPGGPVMTPDEFMDPDAPDKPLNVSGQPSEPERDSRGRYLVTDPATGDFRRFKNGKPMGWTRTTTFNKAASNNKAINDWNRRNIVIGASRLPHLVRDAQEIGRASCRGRGEVWVVEG